MIAKKILTTTTMAIGGPTTVNMKLLKHILFSILLVLPLFGCAQKAYDTVNYCGTAAGMTIKLVLANGYLGASEIQLSSKKHKKALHFIPEKGVADVKQHLKFLTYPAPEQAAKNHFILYGMKMGYDILPPTVIGKYYSDGKQYAIILKKEKQKP